MGCDGGTIPKRDELVRTKKKPEQKDKTSELSFRWQHCAITQQPLQLPVVACELGRLYSKESVLEALLDNKSEENSLKEIAPYIKSLKDVKQLVLTENASWTESVRGEIGDGYIDVQRAKWVCPMSGVMMNGRFRFCCLWTCGCVISEKALKEMIKMKEEGNECPVCQKSFQVLDIVLLNPTEEKDLDTLKEKMSLRSILAKQAKDAKKAGKKREASATVTASKSEDSKSSSSSSEATPEQQSQLVSKSTEDDSPSAAKKSKIVTTPKPPTAAAGSSSGTVAVRVKKESKMKPGTSAYSVAKDPAASEVYKSLFTTHRNAETQERAHWVTYNPFYN